MCVSRASLACCDCYPQRLFGKLGAATAVSGFRAKELDPIIGVATHGSPGNRSDDSRRHTCGQRENIDVHGRLQRKREGRGGHLKQNMATRCDSSGISFQTQCLHGPLSAVSIPDSSGIVYQFQSKLDEICPFVPLKPATENRTPFLFTPLARAMSEKVATNSHETNAEKLRRSSLALRGKRCYHLFLCCVAPTAPAVQPAVSLAV